ncbi:MAG: NADPH-dependent reductase [Peptococcaceae bacterium]|nr:NADPH-dependent reductase [Peptococcaceae bacterium]
MGKKVLGLVASPRRMGNCEMLLKEIMLAGEDWEKEIIYLHELEIKPCKACYRCLPSGALCPEKDDFNYLLDKIAQSDGIILATPCYFLGPNAILKNIMDRFISVGNEADRFKGKPCFTVTTYGIEGWQGFSREFTNLFARFLHLDLKDSFLIKSSYPGECFTDEKLLQALREAGRNLFKPGYISQPPSLACPVCWNPYLSLQAEGVVWCPVCGSRGKIDLKEGNIFLEFTDAGEHRFTPEAMSHHFGEVLPATMETFLARRQEVKELQKKYRQFNWDVEKPAQK